MGGPGERASKRHSPGPTPLGDAEGHGAAPINADLGAASRSESKTSARSETSPAREPGDLGGASLAQSAGRQPREGKGHKPRSQVSEESDEPIVPVKPTNTWVTPVEPAEGRGE